MLREAGGWRLEAGGRKLEAGSDQEKILIYLTYRPISIMDGYAGKLTML